MGNILKLVYDNWYNDIHLPNGRHKIVNDELIKILSENIGYDINYAQGKLRNRNLITKGNPFKFDDSNVHGYFKKLSSDIVRVSDVKDDTNVYAWLVEIRTDFDSAFRRESITVNGVTVDCELKDTISPELVQLMTKGLVKVIVNYCHDPVRDVEQIKFLEDYFTILGVPGENIIYVSGDVTEEQVRSIYPQSKIRVSNVRTMFVHQTSRDVSEYPCETQLGYISDVPRLSDLNGSKRNKKFLCFNRTMRPHRYAIAKIAIKENLLPDSIFSFLNPSVDSIQGVDNIMKNFFDEEVSSDVVKTILDITPYELDTQQLSVDERRGFSSNNNRKEWYTDTYIHLVSETCFRTDICFLSEKTFRPIANLQPFIMIGDNGILRDLRNLGFKTFSDFIDESYDNAPTVKIKMNIIENEIKRLNSLSMDELHELFYQMQDILIYNQQHYLTFTDMNPFEQNFEEIINFYRK